MGRVGLTTTRVVQEAEALADEVGLANVTVAAIASRVGVKMPSLYKHITGLDALHRALALRAKEEMATILARATVGRSDADALSAMCHALRNWAKQHPGRYAATVRAADSDDPANTEASYAVVRLVVDILSGYRLSGDDAIDAIRAIRASIHGFISLEQAGGFGFPADIDRSFDRLVAGLDVLLRGWGTTV